MSTFLLSLRNRIPSGEQLQRVLAAIVAVAFLLGYVAFGALSIWPKVQCWRDLSCELDAARAALEVSQAAQAQSPLVLRDKVEAAETQLAEAADIFFSDAEAAEMMPRLYRYAGQNDVVIVSLQSQSTRNGSEDAFYEVRTFDLRATGAVPKLLGFIRSIREAERVSCSISKVNLSQGKQKCDLSMNIQLYISKQVQNEALPTASATIPASPDTGIGQLLDALGAAWAEGQWQQVAILSEQIMAIDPGRTDMAEKLYLARVNEGNRLLAAGDVAGAVAQFNLALQVKPEGAEALAGLQKTTAPIEPTPIQPAPTEPMPTPTEVLPTPVPQATPTTALAPAYTVHTVQENDTLYSLGKRYGVSVEAIMAANGLENSDIFIGQELRIPVGQ